MVPIDPHVGRFDIVKIEAGIILGQLSTQQTFAVKQIAGGLIARLKVAYRNRDFAGFCHAVYFSSQKAQAEWAELAARNPVGRLPVYTP
jgi:DNA gyrase inhibitor GyrI